ncbi:MAG: guanylate kinase [Deltaproteobacteria bacterium]
MEKADIFVVSAPSGAGKTTICKKLLERVENLRLSVSYTTRPRKKGEVEGTDYYFVTPEVFDKMINSNAFLEHAAVYGHRYGTSRDVVEGIVSRGQDALLEIDVQGGRKVKEALPEAVLIAVFPPDRRVQEQRLLGRGRDSREEMEERMRAGAREMRELLSYDFLVLNDDLDAAVGSIEAIIRAHRLRRERAGSRMARIISRIGEE